MDRLYLEMLYSMNLAIGEVIKTLKNEGVYENTIMVYFFDIGKKMIWPLNTRKMLLP